MSEAIRSQPVVEARDVHRTFAGVAAGGDIRVLRGVDLDIHAGETIAIVGPSGTGKSTLLHALGGLDRPTSGTILLAGRSLAGLNDTDLAELRNRYVGFVFQFHHLLRDFSALENVMIPQLIAGRSSTDARNRARLLLDQVGISHREDHRPSQLSGG